MTVDTTQLPADIQAMIADAVAAALEAAKPAPPRELTDAEKATLFLSQAASYERGEKALPSSSGLTHAAILATLEVLVAHVFPAESEAE
jgi:hypothetical protein